MIRVRFAPSPTGRLHQGNVRTALFNYLFARHMGGQMVLRIEDTDSQRSEDSYTVAIFEELQWLGIHVDEGPENPGAFGPYCQSDRLDIYQKHLDLLLHKDAIYPCFCSQEELDQQRRAFLAKGQSFVYSGRCRHLSLSDRNERLQSQAPFVYRFKVEAQIVEFEDLVYGKKVFDTRNIGDFVLARSDKSPLYLFACAVDDCLMQISHVIRGEDGMSNTPRQILIQRLLGFTPPQYAHLPLILGDDRSLLSKRNGSHSVTDLRHKGYLPEAILNYLALLGWAPPDGGDFLNLETLTAQFDLSKVSRSSAIFDWHKLNYINRCHLGLLSEKDYLLGAKKFLQDVPTMFSNGVEHQDELLIALRPNIQKFDELPAWFSLILNRPDLASVQAKEVLQDPSAVAVLDALREFLSVLPDELSDEDYKNLMQQIKDKTRAKGKKLFMPIRVALTGAEAGPELVGLFSALGKSKILERVQDAIKNL